MSKPIGRPPLYTPELAAVICARLAEGESLRSICSGPGMPNRSVVQGWVIDNHNDFHTQYARAKAIAADLMFDDSLDIADEAVGSTNQGGVDGAAVQKQRLQIDTRKWYLSKIMPKKYGEKIQQEISNPDGSLTLTSDEKAAKLADIMSRAKSRKLDGGSDLV